MARAKKPFSFCCWAQCYTVLLAGGGIKSGHVCDEPDKHRMYPNENPVKPGDLAATMYHLLGIRHVTEIFDTRDRPLHIAAGEPIADIIS